MDCTHTTLYSRAMFATQSTGSHSTFTEHDIIFIELITCPQPDHVTNALRHGNAFKWSHSVAYECLNGFYADGETTLTCTQHGNWSALPPSCIAYMCDTNFSSPLHATTVTSRGSFMPNMALYESDVILSLCHNGYESSNAQSSVCRASRWVPGFMPDCQETQCNGSAPLGGNNTLRTGSSNTYGSTHSYTCLAGYRWSWPFPVLNITCQHDMTWSTIAPDCVRVQCESLDAINNGVWLNATADRVFEDTLVGVCSVGHELVSGNLTRTCIADETWSGADPVCVRRSCSPAIPPQNGRIDAYDGNRFGDTVRFSCDEGYELGTNQSGVLTCQASEQWNGSFPACQQILCPSPPTPLYSGMQPTAVSTTSSASGIMYIYGHVYSYVCDVGHYLIGANNTTCSQTHNWTNPPPICQGVQCDISSLPAIPNGEHSMANTTINTTTARTALSYNQTVTWSCDAGYQLSTVTNDDDGGDGRDGEDWSQRCVHSVNQPGYWDGSAPNCTRVECPVFVSVPNGLVEPALPSPAFQDVVTVRCLPGHELTGGVASSNSTCQPTGNWSLETASCAIINCGAIPNVSNADWQGNASTFGSNIIYTCLPGYEMTSGSAMISCQDDKTWSGTVPTCTRITCSPAALPAHSLVHPALSVYDWGDQITYNCDTGHRLMAGATAGRCSDDGQFNNDHPGCQVVQCPPITAQNGILSSNQGSYGDNITLQCDVGYHVTSGVYSAAFTCLENGTYSAATLPECVPVTCSALRNLTNAFTLDTDASFNAVMQLTCNHGFVGANRTLQSTFGCNFLNASNATIPYAWVAQGLDIRQDGCSPVQCLVPSVANFDYIAHMSTATYGDTVGGDCVPGHELTGGDVVRSCVVDVSNNGVGMLTGNVPPGTVIILDTVTTSADMEMNISTIDL
ncbi:sushi, von Willebrand factor type A, EGF and pentraxin domain-containing protein 1-like [Sycon ciliatum]|uniref:sushi, von Willebrand factor type A, EGF and pentraxin domain-containing protein 1-like n=1 Tax=Sycon ciliatum TaxID=27933 RepID=UPI0031F721FC